MELNLKKFKDLCYKRHITLKQLAQKTGISQTALTMAMHRNSTTLETFKKLADFFDVPMEYFFDGVNEDIYDSLTFYLNVRHDEIMKLFNCPPSLNEAMDYHINALYQAQQKINSLLTSKTQSDEKTIAKNQTSIQPK